jgi:hypothetical protein
VRERREERGGHNIQMVLIVMGDDDRTIHRKVSKAVLKTS